MNEMQFEGILIFISPVVVEHVCGYLLNHEHVGQAGFF